MLKRTKLSILSTLIYFIFAVGGGALALYMYLLINRGDAGIGAIGLAAIMIIGLMFYRDKKGRSLIYKLFYK